MVKRRQRRRRIPRGKSHSPSRHYLFKLFSVRFSPPSNLEPKIWSAALRCGKSAPGQQAAHPNTSSLTPSRMSLARIFHAKTTRSKQCLTAAYQKKQPPVARYASFKADCQCALAIGLFTFPPPPLVPWSAALLCGSRRTKKPHRSAALRFGRFFWIFSNVATPPLSSTREIFSDIINPLSPQPPPRCLPRQKKQITLKNPQQSKRFYSAALVSLNHTLASSPWTHRP
ncbi:hypothetical protein MSL71_38240 [Desulfoluna butyratoxydans]|uniref:Uncharacterized protein n=1 Tax=Desulfoluna butyratoxydans TaxID=231438 RepID=A0A4U8YQM8_9BACT|nr:hypothetical protein MSL71_38240 [Desulfoluna butyratoxydans]